MRSLWQLQGGHLLSETMPPSQNNKIITGVLLPKLSRYLQRCKPGSCSQLTNLLFLLMGGAARFWSKIKIWFYSVSKLISWCVGPSSGSGLVGWGAALLWWQWSSAKGERSHTPKGLTLASECGAIQRHILLWRKVRNWKVSAGSWVIGTCYYCVPPPPFNNLFIEIPLLQISLHSHKARFFKKYIHSYSCQVWILTSFMFLEEKGWFFVVSRHLSSLLARVTAAHEETIPGWRCNPSINTKPGRQAEWLGVEFCLLVILGLEARGCVGCLSDVGLISTGACTVTSIAGEHGRRRLAFAPGISGAVNPTSCSCIKWYV